MGENENEKPTEGQENNLASIIRQCTKVLDISKATSKVLSPYLVFTIFFLFLKRFYIHIYIVSFECMGQT